MGVRTQLTSSAQHSIHHDSDDAFVGTWASGRKAGGSIGETDNYAILAEQDANLGGSHLPTSRQIRNLTKRLDRGRLQ